MRKVLIVGSTGYCAYGNMFREMGWEIAKDIEEADLVQFTGGHDVSPELYGCGRHPTTMNSIRRDELEQDIYRDALDRGIPMAGICRGGQFLNVMNGGRMYQHVDGHAVGATHHYVDEQIGYQCQVTSTHHQMMIAHDSGRVIGRPPNTLSSYKEYVDNQNKVFIVQPEPDKFEMDVEAVHYPQTNCLCFQPHPEFEQGKDCREYYFGQIEGRLLGDYDRLSELIGGHEISDNGDGFLEVMYPEEEY